MALGMDYLVLGKKKISSIIKEMRWHVPFGLIYVFALEIGRFLRISQNVLENGRFAFGYMLELGYHSFHQHYLDG